MNTLSHAEVIERRSAALSVVDRLLNGEKLKAGLLLRSSVEKQSPRWLRKFIQPFVKDGTIKVTGNTIYTQYEMVDRDRLSKVRRRLLDNKESHEHFAWGNFFEMDNRLRSFLDGLLIGDGHYVKPLKGGLSSALVIAQCMAQAEWVVAIKGILSQHDIECTIRAYPPAEGVIKKTGQHLKGTGGSSLRTKAYRTFLPERQRWYPCGKKRVPRDLDVTDPVMLAQWYMGDGFSNKYAKGIGLCTNGFPPEDVRWLQDQIRTRLGISSSLQFQDGYPVLFLYSWHAARFLDLIKPHVLLCFQHKMVTGWVAPKCAICGVLIEGRISTAKYCALCHPWGGFRIWKSGHKESVKPLIIND